MIPAPIEWKNGYGRSFWQPIRDDAEPLVRIYSYYVEDAYTEWGKSEVERAEPVMYRSRRRAERVAARASRRRLKAQMTRVERSGS